MTLDNLETIDILDYALCFKHYAFLKYLLVGTGEGLEEGIGKA